MSNNLVKTVSRLFFGTTIAGIGLGFGRDIYKSFKKNFLPIIFFILFLGGLILPFISAIKSFSWQPTSTLKSFFLIKLPWAIVSVFGLIILSFYFHIFFGDKYQITRSSPPWLFPISTNVFLISLQVWTASYIVGAIIAVFKRNKQKVAYEIEKYNELFLENNGIEELDGGSDFTHIDSNGNMLKLTNIGLDVIVFKAVGKRNKKAFILLDNKGRFTEYSGIISA